MTIGRKEDSSRDLDLGMGTTLVIFKSVGNVPFEIDELKRNVKMGARSVSDSFRKGEVTLKKLCYFYVNVWLLKFQEQWCC